MSPRSAKVFPTKTFHGKIRSKCLRGRDGTRRRRRGLSTGLSTERRGCRGGAKKRARFAIKSPIKLFEWSLRVHKGTKSKLRPKSPNGRSKAVNLFEGIFITADGRRVGRRESGDATEVRARQSGAQISAASRPVTHPSNAHPFFR